MTRLLSTAFVLCCLFASIGCNQAKQLAQNLVTVQATWADSAVNNRGNVGVRYAYVCPPNPTKTGVGVAWGTDIYTDDSSVCAAAVHAGKITFAGGTATIEMRGGRDAYSGSARNGVTTQDWGAWQSSFVVL